MTISVGDKLPDAQLLRMGDNGPEPVELAKLLGGRKVLMFALPGAFTPTCHSAHLPSFIRTSDQIYAKGVDEIICISVNDVFVMGCWDQASGASEAGIAMLADADSGFTKSIGMDFTAPPVGFYSRSSRYAMLVEDGVVTVLQVDEPGTCAVSTGESILAAI